MNKTPIEWVRTYAADGTWTPGYTVNPIRARWKDDRYNAGRSFHYCQKISAGCKNCYSSRFQPRFGGLPFDETAKAALDAGEIEIYLDQQVIEKVLRFRKTVACFPFDMTDLFGDWVPNEMIDTWWAVMALTPNVTYRILTKRAERMNSYIDSTTRPTIIDRAILKVLGLPFCAVNSRPCLVQRDGVEGWPLPNVQLGVSAENQETLDQRVPWLLKTPAAKRFVSYEPALGPVEFQTRTCTVPDREFLRKWRCWACWDDGYIADSPCGSCNQGGSFRSTRQKPNGSRQIDWVIAGGESGPGARPPHPDWFRSVRDQCVAAGVPFFFKQWGQWEIASHENGYFGGVMPESGKKFTWVGRKGKTFNPSAPEGQDCWAMDRADKKKTGRLLDGREWNEFPIVQ